MVEAPSAVEVELRVRVERQRVVITTQAEILESLGFDMSDIADCPERVQAPPRRERLRWMLIGWLVPSPTVLAWVGWDYSHPLHGAYEAAISLLS
jgi:hypothetical protein